MDFLLSFFIFLYWIFSLAAAYWNKFIMQSILNDLSKLCPNSFARLPNLRETLRNPFFICYFSKLKIQTTLRKLLGHLHSRTCALRGCTVEEKRWLVTCVVKVWHVCAHQHSAHTEVIFWFCCELMESWGAYILLCLGRTQGDSGYTLHSATSRSQTWCAYVQHISKNSGLVERIKDLFFSHTHESDRIFPAM